MPQSVQMACPRVDWIVGTSIIVYFATAVTELVSSVPIGLVLVSVLIRMGISEIVGILE